MKPLSRRPRLPWGIRCTAFFLALAAVACSAESHSTTLAGRTVTLEVFSDPQCLACRQFYQENLKPALDELGALGLQVVHHLVPLPFHQHARQASLWVLAGDQLGPDGPAQVLAALFATQPAWSQNGDLEGALASYFSQEQLVRMRERAKSPEVLAQLEGEVARASSRKVSSVPTIFVVAQGERQRVPSTVQYPILRRYLHRLLQR